MEKLIEAEKNLLHKKNKNEHLLPLFKIILTYKNYIDIISKHA